jgi:fumarylacetoacetase
MRLSKSNTQRGAYWSPAQLVAHHTVNGCNLQAGDLLGSGTLSGPDAGEAGSLLEISKGGKRQLKLPSGEQRSFLADGDTLTLRGYCERDGYARIGFGEASATVLTT